MADRHWYGPLGILHLSERTSGQESADCFIICKAIFATRGMVNTKHICSAIAGRREAIRFPKEVEVLCFVVLVRVELKNHVIGMTNTPERCL